MNGDMYAPNHTKEILMWILRRLSRLLTIHQHYRRRKCIVNGYKKKDARMQHCTLLKGCNQKVKRLQSCTLRLQGCRKRLQSCTLRLQLLQPYNVTSRRLKGTSMSTFPTPL